MARDPNETFTFNFRDVNGKLVSNDDPHFKNKVVLAIVTGTWCPNCHDEAQYLVQLDKKYRDKGLAIVALDFEEPEQQGTLAARARLHQEVWREIRLSAGRRPGGDVGEGAPAEPSRYLAGHGVHRPRRQGEGGAFRLCLARQR